MTRAGHRASLFVLERKSSQVTISGTCSNRSSPRLFEDCPGRDNCLKLRYNVSGMYVNWQSHQNSYGIDMCFLWSDKPG